MVFDPGFTYVINELLLQPATRISEFTLSLIYSCKYETVFLALNLHVAAAPYSSLSLPQ